LEDFSEKIEKNEPKPETVNTIIILVDKNNYVENKVRGKAKRKRVYLVWNK